MIKEDHETLNKVIGKRSLIVKIMYIALQLMTIATLIAIIVFYVRDESEIALSTFIMQLVMCSLALIVFNAMLILEHVFKFFIPDYLLLICSGFVFVNCIIGNVFQLFNTQSGVFDKILHVATGIICVFFALSIVNLLNDLPKMRWKLSPFFIVLFCFCFSMMIAVMWEIFEYMLDSIEPSLNMQRWADGFIGEVGDSGTYLISDPRGSAMMDTMWDMTCNVIGSMIACGFCHFKIRKYSAGWIIRQSVLTPKQQKILVNEQKKMLEAQQELVPEKVVKENKSQLFDLRQIFFGAFMAKKRTEDAKQKDENGVINEEVKKDLSEKTDKIEKNIGIDERFQNNINDKEEKKIITSSENKTEVPVKSANSKNTKKVEKVKNKK